MKHPFVLTAAALLLTALPAFAQDRPVRNRAEESAVTVRRIRDVVGAPVFQDGRRLGRVSDLTLNDDGGAQELIVRTDKGVVLVPYSSVRYDTRQRGYVVSDRVTPRPAETLRSADDVRESPGDRFARSARLSREGSAEAPRREATIQRTTPALAPVRPSPDPVSEQLQDFARAARIYSTPVYSVSVTGNVDRLPRRSIAYDNYTIASEVYGLRSGLPLPPPLPLLP